jgi:hypothetical protein
MLLVLWLGGRQQEDAVLTMWDRIASVKLRDRSQNDPNLVGDNAIAPLPSRFSPRQTSSPAQESNESHPHRISHPNRRGSVNSSSEFQSFKPGSLSSRLRVVLAALIFLRFLWNIIWLHNMGSPRPASPSLLYSPFVPSYTEPRRQIASREQTYQNDGTPLLQYEDSDEELLAFVEASPFMIAKRRRRNLKTRPPMYEELGAGKNSTGDQKSESIESSVSFEQSALKVPQRHDWASLCAQAKLNSTSRVLISGALTHPLGYALALLIGKQCFTQHYLLIDPMYPPFQGSDSMRLAQLERYKTLKRTLPFVQLLTPKLVGARTKVAWHLNNLHKETAVFAPSHMIHLDMTDRNYRELGHESAIRMYSIRSGLMSLDSVLSIQASVRQTTSQMPTLVYVTTRNATMTTSVQSVLARTYWQRFGLDLVRIEMPVVYGPLVGGLVGSVDLLTSKMDLSQVVYVDDAVSGILQAFAYDIQDSKPKSIGWDNNSPDNNHNESAWMEERRKLNLHRINETLSWESGESGDHLGDSLVRAEYFDVFGIPQTVFPCSSSCESMHCLSSALDTVQNVTSTVTSACDYILYIVDVSRRFSVDYLYPQKQSEEESEYSLCRLAFVSARSRLTRKLLLSPEDYEAGLDVSEAKVKEENGKHVVKGWLLIFLPDFANDAEQHVSTALLRIDPSRMFNRNVAKALYTEIPAFMKASVEQLESTFDDMTRYRTAKYVASVRRRGVNGLRKVLIPSQKSRKVIFYAQEPKPSLLPDSLADFVANADTDLSQGQIDFYEDSADKISSRLMRTSVFKSTMEREGSTPELLSFPYQWLSSGVYVHDLEMSHSHELRCHWLREFLFWGGSADAEMLSFAYVFGKLQIQKKLGARLVELNEPSWIPLLNPADPEKRLRNAEDWEVFIRILDR